ncbi:MAG TPA: antibiotic biosynthesis monooxygenase [Gaiellaceae bacterium]|nr:antibiotic biosynthesis monooxygenase [Gaiellaceae bacterium]
MKEDFTMHARVTSLNGSPGDVEAGIANFRENVVGFASEERGKGAILLVDRTSGNALAITLWEDEEAMQASEESANALRAQAAEQMGAAGQPEIARYEVAVFET